MKTSELAGAALDWAVDQIEGGYAKYCAIRKFDGDHCISYIEWSRHAWRPSTDWSQGGPIIERELLQVSPRFHAAGYKYPKGLWYWQAYVLGPHHQSDEDPFEQSGPTPLIAAMRCYVASKLGDEVDIPEELK